MSGRGADDAGVVDRRVDDMAGDVGGDVYRAALRGDEAGIGNRRVHSVMVFVSGSLRHPLAQREAIKIVAVEIDGEGLRRAKSDRAVARADDAVVAHARS